MNDQLTSPQPSSPLGSYPEADIDIQIAEAESRLGSYHNRRAIYYFLGAIGLLSTVVMLFGRQIFASSPFENFPIQAPLVTQAPLMGFAFAAYSIFTAAYLAVMRQSRVASLRQELDVLRAKKRILYRGGAALSETSPRSYFDRLVDINVTNLEAYYGLVKIHTDNSFQVSIAAGCIGFLLIITGLILGFTNITNAPLISYLSAGAGIITEFIAGVFFYLYNRTVRQLKEYHDSLIRVQNILLSFKIVGDTQDDERKNILLELMLKCLIATQPELVSEDVKQSTESKRA